jgi:ribosome maturation factor RimP
LEERLVYTVKKRDPLIDTLEPVVSGLGFRIVDSAVARHKGSAQVRLVIYRDGPIGTGECSRVHHAVLPRLELALAGANLYLEVSSPGIDRVLKDAAEAAYYAGRGIRCYRTDISDWTSGILESADETHIVIKEREKMTTLNWAIIAKARLDTGIETELRQADSGEHAEEAR